MPNDKDTIRVVGGEEEPVWARPDTFKKKPESSRYGFFDSRRKIVEANSVDELVDKLVSNKSGITMVWSPSSDRLVVPEELKEIRLALWERRRGWASDDVKGGQKVSLLFSIALIYYLFRSYQATGNLMQALQSPGVGVVALFLLILGLVPWYEGWKTLWRGEPKNDQDWDVEVAESRFDSWLSQQKSPITSTLVLMVFLVAAAQFYREGGVNWSGGSLERAGLYKGELGEVGSEWWRFFTAPLLHGNVLHLLMNVAALRYLGGRVESLARWPHVFIITVVSAVSGSYFTFKMMSAPSVGLSGGIMGLLGFLLVFESLHKLLVPKPTRRRLLAGVVLTILMGGIGFTFIDNAAHLGGLLAGAGYAAWVFPSSVSPQRPQVMKADRWIALVAAGILLISTVLTLMKILVL